MTDLEKVEEFYKEFKIPMLENPAIPQEERVQLRLNLLREELEELKDACEAKDMVDICDALGDLQYILLGTVLEFGLGGIFERVFDLVHESNMTKIAMDEETADRSIEMYKTQRGTLAYKEETESGGWIIRRQGDHKILKSIAYVEAEPFIKKLLDAG